MMRMSDDARTVVSNLKRRYGSIEPEEMCRDLKILIREQSMGECRGFFLKQSRIKLIMLNSELSDKPKKVVLCHELGHAVLHANARSACGFHDAGLFDTASQCEREANEFAAEYLIDDSDVLDTYEEGTTIFDAARVLGVPPELLNVKYRIMQREGYKMRPPLNVINGFMGRMIIGPFAG